MTRARMAKPPTARSKNPPAPAGPGAKPPFHPYLVLAMSVFPGVGQIFNGDSKRAFMFAFSMLSLGWITYHLTSPDQSFLGRYAGGVFVYAMSILDAYKQARLRWELWHFRRRQEQAVPDAEP
jgi:hypothetical protein